MGKMRNDCSKGIVLFCVILNVVSTFTLASIAPSAHAEDSVVTTTSITISQSCSMTSTVNTPHNATVINGTYSGSSYPNGIGQTTLKAFCNDNAGFAIYAIGFTDDEYGNTKLHSSTLGSTYDINTGIYNSSSASSSTWSMKLTSVSGTYAPTIADGTNGLENFTTWHVVPSTYTKVAYRTSGTDVDHSGSGIGSSLTTTYDAYVSATQPAGTYVGQVKYTLVHPSTEAAPMAPLKDSDCPAGYVCYAPNANDIEGSMSSLGSITSSPTAGKISVGTSATTINLIAPNYKREGYGFAGWSTDFTATNASTIYGPNETLTVPSDTLATKGMILYPVWVANAGNLQGWNGCSSLTTAPTNTRATLSSVTALTDTRDGNIYAVARLADGKCWMIENLRLDDSATLTTTNTHNPLHDTNNTVILNANGTTASHLAASYSGTWCSNNISACDNQTMLNTNNTRLSDSSLTPSYSANNAVSKWYGYGNYYNWYSATAGNGTYDKSPGNVDGDLCPTGWHLPYGGDGTGTGGGNTAGGFYYLNTQMSNDTSAQGSKDWRTYPNNFVYSGYWSSTRAYTRSTHGDYWSSSAGDSHYAYYLILESSNVKPGTKNYFKYFGLSVRCVAGS